MKAVLRHRLFWPAAILVVMLLGNRIFTPTFFTVVMKGGHLYGSLIDILLYGAPLMLIALGMTTVIATGGIDLSVGATVAISGAVACSFIAGLGDQNSISGVITAVALALGLALLLGVWNGVLVTGFGIQPIIATLVLMVAG